MNSAHILKPRDLVVVLGILLQQEQPWSYSLLSEQLLISKGSISNAVKRLKYARLLYDMEQQISIGRRALLEFVIHGLPYTFPLQVNTSKKVRGVPTCYNVYPLNKDIAANGVNMVWKSSTGSLVGYEVEPLYDNAVAAAASYPKLHRLLSIIDTIRLQHARSYNIARRHLENLIKNKNYNILEDNHERL